MSVIHLNRTAALGFGNGAAAMLPRAVGRVRAAVRKVCAAIAAARLHHLREIAERGDHSGTGPERQPRMPLLLGDKWDF